jgi:hypothetical protein
MKRAMAGLFRAFCEGLPNRFVIFACIFASVNVTPALAQSLKLPGGQMVEAAKLPFYRNRPKILDFLRKAGQQVAVAVTPEFCPGYSYTAWNSDYLDRAIRKCDAKTQIMLSDYPASFRKSCACKLLVKDMAVTDADLIMNQLRYTTLKLFFKSPEGAVRTVRGVLEYEKAALQRQSMRILNQKRDEICRGSMTPSLGDNGAFELSCFDGNRRASGSVTIPEIFHQYALGSGVFENGEVFAFVARLTDEEIKSKYPNFPDVRAEAENERNDGG